MVLINLYTNKTIVSRLSAISGDKTAYATVTAEYVCIQRMSDEKATMLGQAIGKVFRMYAEENADIQKGDKLVENSSGNEYKVLGVSIPAELGNFIHQECVILKVN